MISTDGQVELEERIWMSKLCEHNLHARELRDSLLFSDNIKNNDV